MSLGLILLIAVGILVLAGVAQRVLDKIRLTDKQAMLFVALIFLGGLIPDIPLGPMLSVNIGGALVPLGLCVYLWIKAGTAMERARSAIAAVLTAVAVYLIGHYFPNEPETMPMDPNYLYGIAGGVIAYLLGRSRRGAFIAGVVGVLLADAFQAAVNWAGGIEQPLNLGGAGAIDAVVISGLIAVLLGELVGEIVERISRGTHPDTRREFAGGEFIRRERRK